MTEEKQPTPPTDTPSVDRQALSELAAAMQDLKQSVDNNTSTTLIRPAVAPLQTVTTQSDTTTDEGSVDFTDPVSVKKYIDRKMSETKDEANKAYIIDQARRTYDALVDQDFPDLKNKSSSLYKETINEVRRRMGMEGISSIEEMRQKTPSVFYDAACTAALRLNRQQRPESTVEGQRLSGLTGGYVEGGSNPPPPPVKPSGLTPEQRYFAEKLGVDPKVAGNIKYEKGSDGTYRLAH